MPVNDSDKNAATIKKLNSRFQGLCFLGVMVILLFGGNLINNIVGVYEEQGDFLKMSDFDVILAHIKALFPLLFLCVYIWGARLCYLAWEQIPKDIARTTPGKAAWLLFIPIFHLFWIFVAVWGLARDMNKTLAMHPGTQNRVSEFLGLTVCALPILFLFFAFCFPPYAMFIEILDMRSANDIVVLVAQMTFIVWNIVWILFFKSVKNGAIAMLG